MFPLNEHERFPGIGRNFSGKVFRPSLSSRFTCPIDKNKWLSITSSALLIITFALGCFSVGVFGKHNLNIDYIAKFAVTISSVAVAIDFSLFFSGQNATRYRLKSLALIVANITIIVLAILALKGHVSLNQLGIAMTVSSFALFCCIACGGCFFSKDRAPHPPTRILQHPAPFENRNMEYDWKRFDSVFSPNLPVDFLQGDLALYPVEPLRPLPYEFLFNLDDGKE